MDKWQNELVFYDIGTDIGNLLIGDKYRFSSFFVFIEENCKKIIIIIRIQYPIPYDQHKLMKLFAIHQFRSCSLIFRDPV